MNTNKTIDTLVIQLTHEKALKLLLELEELHLIRVINLKDDNGLKLSEKYSGKLSADTGGKLQEHVKQSRDEWGSRT